MHLSGWTCYGLNDTSIQCVGNCFKHNTDCVSHMQTIQLYLNLFTGRKRKWFKVDEAIRVLQSHKPVHAEYLHRLKGTCNPTCTPMCGPANGNGLSSHMTDDDAPHYVVCSTHCSDLVSR